MQIMTRIDRYLMVLFIRVYLVCFVTLAGLLIIAQIFTNLDELLEYGRIRGSLPLALAEYFGPVLLTIFDRTCGLTALLSTLFVVAWLYRTNEWTAMLAAGISKARVIRPILIVCAVVITLSAVSREFWIPKYSHILTRTPQDLQGTERLQPIRPTEDSEFGILIAGKNIVEQTQTIRNPVSYSSALHPNWLVRFRPKQQPIELVIQRNLQAIFCQDWEIQNSFPSPRSSQMESIT